MSGLRRATLAALATREWSVEGKPLTGAEVVALYEALSSADTRGVYRAVNAGGASDRRFDRAIQILRRAGLVKFKQNEWRRIGETVSDTESES